jgi:uncharacterized protein (DUF362 family)
MSEVVVIKADYTALQNSFSTIFHHIGSDMITQAKQITIKINLCDYRPPESGATTHPVFLDAFLEWVESRNSNAIVSVVESNATRARPDLIRNWLGITQILEKHHAKWVNLSNDKWSRKQISGMRFRSIRVPETITSSDLLISMAKMKTHSLTTISCSLKNMYGCIMSSNKINFHDYLDEAIVDACTAMRPHLSIVDGIIGMGGPKGPVDGVPIRAELIVAGLDPVAVDAASATIMGLNPNHIGHVRKAQEAKIGSMKFNAVPNGLPQKLPNFELNEIYRSILRVAATVQRRTISWS